MNYKILSIVLLSICLMTACKNDKQEENVDVEITETPTTEIQEETKTVSQRKEKPAYFSESKKVAISLKSKNDSSVTGNVVFTQDEGIVTMVAVLNGLTPGQHAIHVLNGVDCSVDSAELEKNKETHMEDFGLFTANGEGRATITKITEKWCIGCEDESKDISSSSFFVFEGKDDLKSILACGAINQ
ncbi:MAG: superoxide dismutase family protein [Psychroserpens sp.]|nr:superoxide dismutase family protein [Psychroserpens sp.]